MADTGQRRRSNVGAQNTYANIMIVRGVEHSAINLQYWDHKIDNIRHIPDYAQLLAHTRDTTPLLTAPMIPERNKCEFPAILHLSYHVVHGRYSITDIIPSSSFIALLHLESEACHA